MWFNLRQMSHSNLRQPMTKWYCIGTFGPLSLDRLVTFFPAFDFLPNLGAWCGELLNFHLRFEFIRKWMCVNFCGHQRLDLYSTKYLQMNSQMIHFWWLIYHETCILSMTHRLWVSRIKWGRWVLNSWENIFHWSGMKSSEFHAKINFMPLQGHWPNCRGVPSEQHSFVSGSNGVDRQHFLIFPWPSSGWYGYRLGNWPQQESSGSGFASISSLDEPIFKRIFGFWNNWARTSGGVFFLSSEEYPSQIQIVE